MELDILLWISFVLEYMSKNLILTIMIEKFTKYVGYARLYSVNRY